MGLLVHSTRTNALGNDGNQKRIHAYAFLFGAGDQPGVQTFRYTRYKSPGFTTHAGFRNRVTTRLRNR